MSERVWFLCLLLIRMHTRHWKLLKQGGTSPNRHHPLPAPSVLQMCRVPCSTSPFSTSEARAEPSGSLRTTCWPLCAKTPTFPSSCTCWKLMVSSACHNIPSPIIYLPKSSHLYRNLGLCIPKNSTTFVVRVSEKLARTEINLTLEFLLECLHGIQKVISSPFPFSLTTLLSLCDQALTYFIANCSRSQIFCSWLHATLAPQLSLVLSKKSGYIGEIHQSNGSTRFSYWDYHTRTKCMYLHPLPITIFEFCYN